VTAPAQIGLLPQTWPTICADPPWPFDDSAVRGGVDHHYEVMTVAQICAMPVHEISWPNSHLYLWTTNSHIEPAFKVMRAWGFTYKTLITWDKEKIGTGHYFRGQTEHVLFGVRGRAPIVARNIPTIFRAPRGEHSEKPDEFNRIVERASPGPFLSLFERKPRGDQWSIWGKEAPGAVRLSALDRVLAP
jgi:N6-adenosine-specific RNA methylase IME4